MVRNTLRIALAQLNPTVGDVAGNAAMVRAARAAAARCGADLVMMPELFLAGYPPEGLVLKPAFQDACREACETLARETQDGGPAILVGSPWVERDRLHNAYALLDGGAVAAVRFKVELPNSGVFNEARVFEPGLMPGPIAVRGVRLGVPIGGDVASSDVIECLAETGAEMLLVPSATPYWRGSAEERLNGAVSRVTESGLPLVYLNQIGGQDERVFDGASFVLNANASLAGQLPAFQESVALSVWEKDEDGWRCAEAPRAVIEEEERADYAACVLGLRDYVDKNGFPGVIVELSSGVDTTLCAVLAVDALGPARVRGIVLPAQAGHEALAGAVACAKRIDVRYDVAPIAEAAQALEAALAPLLAGKTHSAGDGQGRIRGTILMSASDALGSLVVTAANKSRIMVNSALFQSEVRGGYNPIKDLYRTEIARLAALRNRWKPPWALGPDGAVIPEDLLRQAPATERRASRTDQGLLLPDDVLNDILECLVERNMRVSEIVSRGHELETVKSVERLVARSEAKRCQAAPGVKLTKRSFERERRTPIINRFHDEGRAAFKPADVPAGSGGGARDDADG